MKRFWAKFILWWNLYCTKHYTKKESILWPFPSTCWDCNSESYNRRRDRKMRREARKLNRVNHYMSILKGDPNNGEKHS